MNTNNIEVNIQSSIRLAYDKVIYFDPYKIEDIKHDADIIFITHSHFDHMDSDSIEKVKNNKTVVVAPRSMEDIINKIEFSNYIYLEPFDEVNIDGINIKTIPAYNNDKNFHPRANNWLGYIVTINDTIYYIAGDTDVTKEGNNVKCDIAFVPIGGYYTMDVYEATEFIKKINPKIVIPIHYGSIVGDIIYGKVLRDNLSSTNIEVIEKIK